MKKFFKGIGPNVVTLGLVSLLTDVSTEMIYPLLPVFLTQYLGASVVFLGVIEGVAESLSSLLKLFVGVVADRARDRSRWVFWGYALSSVARPLVAFAQGPMGVLGVRVADRLGKGVRTSPRDALIADSVEPGLRGKAFGFHRGMDHLGAVIGPLVATVVLAYFFTDLRKLFLLSAIPAFFAVALIVWRVREVPGRAAHIAEGSRPGFKAPKGPLRAYLLVLFVFLLSTSSDAFLILRLTHAGVPPAALPLIWTAFNAVKFMTTMPLGMLSDRLGRRKVILMGWAYYAAIYAALAFVKSPVLASALFIAYGLYYGFTEGTESALMADLAPPGEKGQTFGWYYLAQGAALLPANFLFGFLWQNAGPRGAFLVSAAISTFAALLLVLFVRPSRTLKYA